MDRGIVDLVELDDGAPAADRRPRRADARAHRGTEQRDRVSMHVGHAQALLLRLVEPDRRGVGVQRSGHDLDQALHHAVGVQLRGQRLGGAHERGLRGGELAPGAAQSRDAERERAGIDHAIGQQLLVERQRARGRVGHGAEREAVEDEHLLGARAILLGRRRRGVPALGLLAQAHADALDRQPAAQFRGQRRGHGAAVVQRREFARDAADDGIEPTRRGRTGARRDARERAAPDCGETVEQLARILVGDLGADRSERRARVALERDDDRRDALGAVLGQRRLDAGAVSALDREHEHGARLEQRARLVDDQREHLVAVRGVAPAAATRLARSSERPGRESARNGRLEGARPGTAKAAAIPAEIAPTSTIATSTGACSTSAAAVAAAAPAIEPESTSNAALGSGAAPPRDTPERDGESHASGPAEERRKRCGQAQPVAHDAPLPTIASRYQARREFRSATSEVGLGRVPLTRPTRLLLARPRGYCAGVERAVETVEQMLDLHGPPIYVRKQIVHNIHVVRRLEQQGAIFVESEDDVPEGATVVSRRTAWRPKCTATPRCAGCARSTRPARS